MSATPSGSAELAAVAADATTRAAIRSTYVAFAATGVAYASWAARIPQVRDRLHLSPAELGLVLLTVAAGSFFALPVAGAIIEHFGSQQTVRVTAAISGAAVVAVAGGYLVGVLPVVVGLFVWGFAAATWDVAMNVQAAGVERRLGRAIMSRFHAGFSLGAVAGALVGAGLVALHVPVTAHLGAVGLLVAVGVPVLVSGFLPDHAPDTVLGDRASRRREALARWREPHTLLLGVFVLSFAFAEGVGNDWIGVAVIDGYHEPAALGTLGYACFLTAMTSGRWFGPAAIDRYGRVVVIRACALLGIAGVLLFVFGGHPIVAFAGSLLWGIGASLGFPIGMSSASDDPLAAAGRVGVVSSIGYCAFLAGPPVIGFLADRSGVLHALVMVAALLTVAALIATSVRRPEE